MKTTKEFWSAIQEHSASARTGAPGSLVNALFALVGSNTPIASMMASVSEGDRTDWCAVWVTESDIAYVRAVYPAANWDSQTELGEPQKWLTEIDGWVRPISSVSTIRLTGLENRGLSFDGLSEFTPTYSLVFGADDEVHVPLAGAPRGEITPSDIENIVNAVRAARCVRPESD